MKPIKELINFSVINMDKPSGPTSFWVDLQVRKKLSLGKVSHGGTLDPKVTGVLPLMLGRACRLMNYFMHKNKTYVGVMHMHKDIARDELEKEIKKFIGKIKQTPPLRSRVKREEREREIFSFKILEQEDKDVLFETEVEAGTYIRKLISDLGEKIGGAHMLELRRVGAGIFSEDDKEFVNLYDFNKAVDNWKAGDEQELRKILIPAEEALKKVLPSVQYRGDIKKLLTGKPLMKQEIKIKEERFALFSGEKLVGVYKKVDEGDILARAEFIYN